MLTGIWLALASPAPAAEVVPPLAPPDVSRPRACGWGWGALWPGVGRFCAHQPVEGAVLSTLAAGQLAAAVALASQPAETPFRNGGPAVLLTGLQNLWITSVGLEIFDVQRRRGVSDVPPETLGGLVAAPFRPRVLAHPAVWTGGLALTAGAVAFTVLTNPRIGPRPDPNLFGVDLAPEVGYPALAAVDALHFMHVAVGEEVLFRGIIQGALARELDPTAGWLLGTAIFGAAHLPTAFALPPTLRLPYLVISVPYITLVGAWLGLSYRWSGHRLGPPVAIHFWYDAILGATAFLLDPDDHPFSASIRFRF